MFSYVVIKSFVYYCIYNYIQIKLTMGITSIEGKTIYDFCKDKEVLDFITNLRGMSREEYMQKEDRESILHDLRLLAFITENERLYQLIDRESFLLVDWDMSVSEFKHKYKKAHGKLEY